MPAYVLLTRDAHARTATLTSLGPDGTPEAGPDVVVPDDALADVVGRVEAQAHPRWVWDDTRRWYPALLAAGVRVDRCHDLRLCHAILRLAADAAGSRLQAAPPGPFDAPAPHAPAAREPDLLDALRELTDEDEDPPPAGGTPDDPLGGTTAPAGDLLAELRDQLDAVAGSARPGRLRLLLAAESGGALLAAEMQHDGLPWDPVRHDELLTDLVGPRPLGGGRPRRLEDLAAQVRDLLNDPRLNPDSQPHLLAALRRQGFSLGSTSKWEVRELDHPVVEPLLEYKRLSRLLSANGWAWLDAWVRDGRFRPTYVVGGVVTGRWATDGGGALQLPASLRGAARADPGWRLVVADAAQLEPRVLAAMSGDRAMAEAARGADLYQRIADAGTVPTRKDAKYALLGAIYGATTGTAGMLMPRLTRAYPQAVALVEAAARAGERGEPVSTWLGRTSPPASAAFLDRLGAAGAEGSDPDDVRDARRRARDRGRFTRNFVVQGTAAEWALCWLASLRRRLRDIGDGRAHLVFFLHDEVVVHSPASDADEVAQAVRDAADEAGRLLFGSAPVEFALDLSVVESYADA
ncbi:bifunctional 3'-5' exonuclease/DNA polymerase [Cellulomonas wangsupingiae]|uniref:DNA-directed DNA polymerase n=1 Tax=Cellulomonas wangsupingiae TaxID=2968085 RepID=A0ABY5K3P1_9CELL|nr:bifunctional 3'-5' exonuclease/DNA polymerase [Cellulomonas wangsupingiae]MCC2336165.1 bifunctional 3'-5' exonuclease/DNA polymerase [Cellulomonas wangsupingiae]UUI64590.1 bifunctional 3'-5' exonuclease/DNA polymerase [Cellulomonas wangsupingiae]